MTCNGQETYDLTQTLEEQLLHSFLDPQTSPLLLKVKPQFYTSFPQPFVFLRSDVAPYMLLTTFEINP